MISELLQNLKLVAAFQFLFLSLFFFFNKKGHRTNNRMIAFFTLGKGLALSFLVIFGMSHPGISPFLPALKALYKPMLFFYPPFLFFYIKSCTDENFKFNKQKLFHLMPSLLLLILGMSKELDLFRPPLLYYRVISVFYYVQIISYTASAIFVIQQFKKESMKPLSPKIRVTRQWLQYLMLGFMLMSVVLLTSFIFSFFQLSTPVVRSAMHTAAYFMLFLFATGILYNSLRNPILFSDIQNDTDNKKDPQLPKAVNKETAHALETLMINDRLYLNSNLTLNDVAERLRIHPRTLSLVLKHSFQKNFFDFVNGYRIQHAQNIIKNDNSNKTLFEVLLDSGFNSKSVFNAAFKKHTGITPTVYKSSINH